MSALPLPQLLGICNQTFPGRSPGALLSRARMFTAAVRMSSSLRPLVSASPTTSAGLLFEERPEILGTVLWPYQNADWSAPVRIARIVEHCREVDRLGAPFVFSPKKSVVLADLGHVHPDLKLIMDQPAWFMREGGLTLNLFVGSFRAYSIAFSLFRDADGVPSIYIGAIQGRNRDDALDLYRDLTRSLFGIRPRDFILECLRILGRIIGTERLYAVSDRARQHNHAYFGAREAMSGYDDIWTVRGGELVGSDTFALPLTPPRRAPEEIKAKKRSLYRQRYAFLDELEREIGATLPTRRPVLFTDT